DGLGYRIEFDPDLIIPDMTRSIAGGAIAPWRRTDSGGRGSRRAAATRSQETGVRSQTGLVEQFLRSQDTLLDTPLNEIRPAILEKLFRGDGKEFPGLLTLLEQELATATDVARQEELESFRGHVTCTACRGA